LNEELEEPVRGKASFNPVKKQESLSFDRSLNRTRSRSLKEKT